MLARRSTNSYAAAWSPGMSWLRMRASRSARTLQGRWPGGSGCQGGKQALFDGLSSTPEGAARRHRATLPGYTARDTPWHPCAALSWFACMATQAQGRALRRRQKTRLRSSSLVCLLLLAQLSVQLCQRHHSIDVARVVRPQLLHNRLVDLRAGAGQARGSRVVCAARCWRRWQAHAGSRPAADWRRLCGRGDT